MSKRIAVLGAGGIGGSIGACLIREGHDVTLIDQWSAHVEKMKSDGLRLTNIEEDFTVPARAFHLSEVSNLREQFDIVYLSVKSYDTRWSAYLIEPSLKPTGFILPAQNALNDELVASIVGFNRTVGCVVTISAGVYEPGHVVRTDPLTAHAFTVGELSGLITPRAREVADALKALGPSEVTSNIWGARWSKMVVNCMGNALAGLIGPATSPLSKEQQDVAGLTRIVTGCEVVRVAQALGVEVEPINEIPAREFAGATGGEAVKALKARLEAAWGGRRLTPEQARRLGVPGRPSLLQDVIKGRRTEVDQLNGHVVTRGEEVGVPTPMNRAIVGLMRQLESGELKPDPSNLERLEPYLVK
jgi:2-dehydropantoate 2-reductase